jgi:AcrR family transcriptional regulator
MPLPRFAKLPEDRRHAILDAALEEFAAHGYEGASFNAILEHAQVSKGAIYYYFSDKEDLYATVLERAADAIAADVPPFREVASAPAFWDEVGRLYRAVMELVRRDPRVVRMVQRGAAEIEGLARSERLARITAGAGAFIDRVLSLGQAVGAVRRDLPRPFLLALVSAVGEACDRFVLASGELESDAGREAAAARGVDLFRRLLAPAPDPAPARGRRPRSRH